MAGDMTTATAQVPPQNLDAEESVIGAMMLSSEAISGVQETGLLPGDFYRLGHGTMFRVMVGMNEAGTPVDALTLADELARLGKLDEAGGKQRIHEIATLVAATSNAPHYAKIVREHALARALVHAGETIGRLGWDRPGTPSELIERAESALTRAVDRASDVQKAETLAEGLEQIGIEIAEASKTGVAKRGAATGFPGLDSGVLRGMWPGQFIVLAARPGFGKSTLGQNIAENVADRKEPVLFASLEMSRREMQIRSLARASKIDSRVIEEGLLTDEQMVKLREGYKAVKQRGEWLYTQHDTGMTPTLLRAEARRMKRTCGLSLVVVDYLQLFCQGDPANKVNEVAQITRSLKLLAMDLQIPVIGISQLNRGVERRDEKRPTLADLRDSGAIEQDADVVLFLYSEAAYKDVAAEEASIYEVIVAKNRKGMVGTEKLNFTGRYLSFTPLATSSVPT